MRGLLEGEAQSWDPTLGGGKGGEDLHTIEEGVVGAAVGGIEAAQRGRLRRALPPRVAILPTPSTAALPAAF